MVLIRIFLRRFKHATARTILLLFAVALLTREGRAQTLFLATGGSSIPQLFTVDPTDGTATLIGDIIDENGSVAVTGLAFHPATGVLYGITGNASLNDARSLITINTNTAAATLIGSLGTTVATDISFDSTGTLFAWLKGSMNKIATVDLSTGAATVVGPAGAGAGSGDGGGLAFASTGDLYLARTDSGTGTTLLSSVDPATGVLSDVATLSNLPEFTSIDALTFRANGELYGVNNDRGTTALVIIDELTGAVQSVGALPAYADGLAFAPEFVAQVTARQVFYNGSSWDGNDIAANASDDAAIATDKSALFPGETATFVNYTSYTRGINGIMVDGNFANAGGISVTDFAFKVGNDSTPAGWANAPAPAGVTVRVGAGVAGSDRVSIVWANNAIQKEWLQITVLATANTGLSAPDVFYFGNAIGESGNTTANAQVNVADEIAARNNVNAIGPVPISNHYDYNRDKKVNLADEIAARNNVAVVTALRLITP